MTAADLRGVAATAEESAPLAILELVQAVVDQCQSLCLTEQVELLQAFGKELMETLESGVGKPLAAGGALGVTAMAAVRLGIEQAVSDSMLEVMMARKGLPVGVAQA